MVDVVGDVAIGLLSNEAVSSCMEDCKEAVWIDVGFACLFNDGIEGAFRMIVGNVCFECESAGEYTVELCPSALNSSSDSAGTRFGNGGGGGGATNPVILLWVGVLVRS